MLDQNKQETAAPIAKFFLQPTEDHAETRKRGKPCYRDDLFIEVRHPGRRDTFIGEATDNHKRQFAEAYEAFQKAETEPLDGTPIAITPVFTRTDAEFLEEHGVRTLEKFMAIDDAVLATFPDSIIKKRKQAKMYLEAATDTVAMSRNLVDAQEKILGLQEALAEKTKALEVANAQIDVLNRQLGNDQASGSVKRDMQELVGDPGEDDDE